MRRTGLTRRRALAVAATAAGVPAVLAGCSGSDSGGGERGGGPRPSAAESARRAEVALRRRSAGVSGVLLAGYDEVLGAHPALGARLSPLREATARHVAALAPSGEGGRGAASPGAAAPTAPGPSGAVTSTASADSGAVAPTASAAAGPAGPTAGSASGPVAPDRAGTASAGSGGGAFPRGVPAEPGAALGELAALASRTAAAHTAALAGAPPELARLLASVAAAGAAHAYLLGEGGGA
ncbi:hypothetical protein [Streptomyces thermolilacinus]|uniref:Lipoprotein n=1 Tax=Streptomyces thermolilacinus SPC6 TaxID=1306406 RepID=A0A1D3DPA8_9ACTN|nr:hypothetical protein [Streptomyces thermolilacinus]OEJ94156.1 hypothetical protein J116_006420 [Streptomyces thermolilacinus SPC6]